MFGRTAFFLWRFERFLKVIVIERRVFEVIIRILQIYWYFRGFVLRSMDYNRTFSGKTTSMASIFYNNLNFLVKKLSESHKNKCQT